jgi:hypothetical protein
VVFTGITDSSLALLLAGSAISLPPTMLAISFMAATLVALEVRWTPSQAQMLVPSTVVKSCKGVSSGPKNSRTFKILGGLNLEGRGGTTTVPRSQCDSIASPAAALDAAAEASTLPLTVLVAFLDPLTTWAQVGFAHSLSLSGMLPSAAIIGQVALNVNFPSPFLGFVSALILHFPSFNSGLVLV